MSQDAVAQKQKQPKALYMLFMVEMWERFNYYGMRALLALFMVSTVIGFTKATSSKIYGMFTALVYLTPVIGGYLADKFIGKRHSITIGAILMAMGQFTLASYELIPARLALCIGLVLIIIGNGFFKPNISAIVGELYEENDPRRDGGFTIFYMGINLGAFIAPFVCGTLGQKIAWKYGFMSAGIGMLIGLVWYLVSQKKFLGDIGLYPVSKVTTSNKEELNRPLTKEDKDKIKAISVFVFFAVFFFAFFEQAGTSLTFFAEEATRLYVNLPFFGQVKLESSYFQAINPIFVILLAPIFAKLWLNLGAKKKEPSIPNKFGWGLFLQGIGFAVIAVGASFFLKGGPVSAIWLIGVYFFCTTGELCLSPVGLSMVTKLAPAKLMSLLMGVWLMSSFFGNLLAGWLASFYESWQLTTLFSVPAVLSIMFGVIMWLMTNKVKRWMHGVN
ncbi:Dipeptide/tripeptide permease [Elusimicrobium minutum Pei191]|uniref:Dipeptide/tripeptide permease n=1 Tax=Elusimicrobium minutum (strain Pei191) TaxID=445932 RepID=B2KEV7_ELUMP|nr:peptide MFS transporter [Elusimicrobium minutum]ACC99053.1 Dipeptide/tripeptide permease [Elusimicrobium minutum Pei191]